MQGRRIAERYRLEEPLGRGGMAEVWRAHDLRLDRTVAVKLLVGAADPDALERFRREALAVARIAHPHIVAAYDFGADDGRPYLVMELLAGETLEARLDNGPLPVRDAVDIAAQTCDALGAAHRAGVIHRDVKPGNLIVAPDGTVKVLDFGIARLHDAATALTRTATVVGTSHYLAPEQATGGTADPRADLYALGCVLYAMLTGGPPFGGDNPMGVMYQHLHTPPPPIDRPGVPPALSALVGELLAKQPSQRPANAADVRQRLRGITGLTSVMPAVDEATDLLAAPGPGGRMRVGRAAVPAASAPPELDQPRPALIGTPRSTAGWLIGLGVAVLAAIVLAFVVLAMLPEEQQPATSGPSPSPTAAKSPPPPRPTATDPAGRLAELRTLVEAKAKSGALDAETERKLTEELDKIGEELDKGELEQATEKVAELGRKLEDLVREGRISDATYQELSRSLDRLAQLLPPPGDDDKGKGRGKNKDDD